jgi:E3 ubiquitin-protein ligase DOA10
VERNVAPRVVPADWLPRLVTLVLICWTLVNALTMYLLCVPIPLARAILALLHYPQVLQHDPLNFAIGLTITASVINGVYRRLPRADRWAAMWQSFMDMPLSTLQHGKKRPY